MHELLLRRKDAHIDIVLSKSVGGPGPALGFGHYTLEYDALPEVNLSEVDLHAEVLGKKLRAPIVIGAMTGGTDRTKKINKILALAAERTGIGMALGSQRAMIEHPEVTSSFAVREAAPDLPLLLGNIGAVQVNYGVGSQEIRAIVEAVGADALNFHLNPLQEAIQPEGDTNFAGIQRRLNENIPEIPVPCLFKEVGAGISMKTAAKLAKLPIAGIEVAGTGGTSWAAVESYRSAAGSSRAEIGQRLAGFGVPTPQSILHCRRALGDRVVVASGGLRCGMDMAVSLALGADLVAMAKPFLEAAQDGVERVVDTIESLILELQIICFCTGVTHVRDLRNVQVLTANHREPHA